MAVTLRTPEEKTSYCIGLDVGASFQRFPMDVDVDAFVEGVRDVVGGQAPRLTQPEFTALMRAFHEKLQAQSRDAQKTEASNNGDAGAEFRENNANGPNVEVRESGLHIEMLTEGTGSLPSATDTVRVHYRGTLIDGTEFDSSYARGEPAEFPLNRVIAGWTEGLQQIKAGGKARLVVPPELGYGSQGAGQLIGPNATLIFEVELLDILD